MRPRADATRLSVPGPPPTRLLGRAGNVVRFFRDPILYPRKLFDRYGRVVSLAAGGGTNMYSPLPDCPGSVLAYGSDVVKAVAMENDVYLKYPMTATLYPIGGTTARTRALEHFGVGLFGANHEDHRRYRRLLMPAFNRRQIDRYAPRMAEIAEETLDRFRPGSTIDVRDEMRLLTMTVAARLLFGEAAAVRGAGVSRLIQDSLRILANPMTTLLPLDLPGFAYRRLLDHTLRVDRETREIIASLREGPTDGNDVLSLLLAAKDPETGDALTEDDLVSHLGVLFAAGHETSYNALTWTLFLLSQHPEVAADLADELSETLRGAAPTAHQIHEDLPLLDRVVSESMRALTPVPWNARVTAQPTKLVGHELPVGTEVYVGLHETHHMPELYPEPDRFLPRRWESISPTIFEYSPFSCGPRTCIGAGFATMEIKVVLALLLQRVRLEFASGQRIDRIGVIVTSPRNGLRMHVRPPDRAFGAGVGGVRGNVRDVVRLPD